MRKSRGLLCMVLGINLLEGLGTSLVAKTYSKKTFLVPRAVGSNLPMELSSWHEYPFHKLERREGHNIHGHLQLTSFYQNSENKTNVGTYFGIGNGKNNFVVATSGDFDVDGLNLIHDYNLPDPSVSGKITFEPKQDLWGVRLDYFHDFGSPINGFFFKANMPVVWIENNIGMSISDPINETVGNKEFSLKDFFAGKVNVTEDMDPLNLQKPLEKAKIIGSESRCGLADLNLAFGYKVHQSESTYAFLSIQAILPTGSRPNGEFLFAPVVGNGNHFGLGGRLDGTIELWRNAKYLVKILFDADYRYIFESTEYRTVGVRDFTPPVSTSTKLAHYYMVGKLGLSDAPLFPAANVLTQGLKISPKNQVEIFADLSFKSGAFVLDLGYNLFYKDGEGCRIKNWTDNVYAIARRNFPTNATLGDPDTVLVNLNKNNLDVEAIKTPSQITNKIVTCLGYLFDYTRRVPGLVGVGGSYEFVADNSALENYSIWLKLSVSF